MHSNTTRARETPPAKISKKKSHHTKKTRSFLSGKEKQNKTDWLPKKRIGLKGKRLRIGEEWLEDRERADRAQRAARGQSGNGRWRLPFSLLPFCVGPPFGYSFGLFSRGVRFPCFHSRPFSHPIPCPLFTHTRSMFSEYRDRDSFESLITKCKNYPFGSTATSSTLKPLFFALTSNKTLSKRPSHN